MTTDLVFVLLILFMSAVVHEVAHGYMANRLGDPTARLQGRLTLNPLVHIDPVGTIMLPLLLVLTGSPFFFAYAKPVPYNPYNLHSRYGEAWVAFAGPGVNLLLAIVFGLLVRLSGAALSPNLQDALVTVVYINVFLALFNLIPLPPLDGSKVLGGLLEATSRTAARSYQHFLLNFQRIGLLPMIVLVVILFSYVLQPIVTTIVGWLVALLTGAPL